MCTGTSVAKMDDPKVHELPWFKDSPMSSKQYSGATELFVRRECAHVVIKVLPLVAMAPHPHVAVGLAIWVVTQWLMSYAAPEYPLFAFVVGVARFAVLVPFSLDKEDQLERIVAFAIYMACFRDVVNAVRMGLPVLNEGVDWRDKNMTFRQSFLDSSCNGLHARVGGCWEEGCVRLPKYAVVGAGSLAVGTLLELQGPALRPVLWVSAFFKFAGALVLADMCALFFLCVRRRYVSRN